MAMLKQIIGLRSDVSALIYETYNGMKLCVGGFYYGDNQIIKIDGSGVQLTDEFSEFHWNANNLELIK